MNELSIEQLLTIEEKCINPQDAIIAHLLIEGVEVHEIIYLKEESLDIVSHVLTITDSARKKRHQVVSQKCVDLYQKALKQSQYRINNHFSARAISLKDTGFLIKASLEDYSAHEDAIHNMDSVIYQTIYDRLCKIELGRFIFR